MEIGDIHLPWLSHPLPARWGVDWVGVSIPLPVAPTDWAGMQALEKARACLHALSGEIELPHAASQAGALVGPGTHGYKEAASFPDVGVIVRYGHPSGRPHIQLSGKGCRLIDTLSVGQGHALWQRIFSMKDGRKFSRVDVCVDVYVPEASPPPARQLRGPLEWERYVTNKKVSTRQWHDSQDGQTLVLGSRSSDRYVRIYRFNPPHPRTDWTRIEFELKDARASAAAKMMASSEGDSTKLIASQLLDYFGSGVALARTGESALPATRMIVDRAEHAASTRWLFKVALPAVREAIIDGTIDKKDFEAWLRNVR